MFFENIDFDKITWISHESIACYAAIAAVYDHHAGLIILPVPQAAGSANPTDIFQPGMQCSLSVEEGGSSKG